MVEDPGTSRNNMHENRETSKASASLADRSAKAQSHNADMHVMEESDCDPQVYAEGILNVCKF